MKFYKFKKFISCIKCHIFMAKVVKNGSIAFLKTLPLSLILNNFQNLDN